MRVSVAVVLVLVAGSYAGCFGKEVQGPITAEAAEPWDGSLMAFVMDVDPNRFDADGKRLPPHYTLTVIPTPGAPLEMPRQCRMGAHPGVDEVACVIDTARPWERTVWGSCLKPDGQDYIITWLLRIIWSGAEPSDGADWPERVADWAAIAVKEDGSRHASWNGTAADCRRADLPIHLQPPPRQVLASWAWQGRNSTLTGQTGNDTTSFWLPTANCLVVDVNGTIDRFGYRMRLLRGGEAVWTDHVDADPARQDPMPHDTNTLVHRPGFHVRYDMEFEHDGADPPSADLAQTHVHVKVIAYLQCPRPD